MATAASGDLEAMRAERDAAVQRAEAAERRAEAAERQLCRLQAEIKLFQQTYTENCQSSQVRLAEILGDEEEARELLESESTMGNMTQFVTIQTVQPALAIQPAP